MIALLDVHYSGGHGHAACVLASSWEDATSSDAFVVTVDDVMDYAPGQFFRRELPCLTAVLERVDVDGLEAIVVDGYVFLDRDDTPGLGAHLYESLGGKVPVVGVAKNSFGDAESFAELVFRGESARPLYVTAAGMEGADAARCVEMMHGPFRIPTLVREADRLCRGFE